MYQASEAFHTAVANAAHQIALLIFDDAVFTNDDINVTTGIEFSDYFNTDEDLSIGRALSNQISFSIFNDHGLLNNYEFGDFTATIGAKIGDETVAQQGTVYAESTSHTYTAYSSSPYLKRDGTAVSSQPAKAIKSMLIYDGTVYCLLINGAVVGYNDSTGATKSVTLNNFMKRQLGLWAGKGISYADRILRIWKGNKKRTYEFVPLGRFNAERPNVPTVNEIHFTCYDLMQRFEKDMIDDETLAAQLPGRESLYPLQFGDLFVALCNYVGVPYRTATFINSTAKITSRPDDFKNVTMREVLQWLAEAAGSVARFDRDGYLIMDWVRSTNQTLDEHGYIEFSPYWYQTKRITKLYNRASNGDYDKTAGTDGEAYLIQDNPLLKGVEYIGN